MAFSSLLRGHYRRRDEEASLWVWWRALVRLEHISVASLRWRLIFPWLMGATGGAGLLLITQPEKMQKWFTTHSEMTVCTNICYFFFLMVLQLYSLMPRIVCSLFGCQKISLSSGLFVLSQYKSHPSCTVWWVYPIESAFCPSRNGLIALTLDNILCSQC